LVSRKKISRKEHKGGAKFAKAFALCAHTFAFIAVRKNY
jgi:hypothetical protein